MGLDDPFGELGVMGTARVACDMVSQLMEEMLVYEQAVKLVLFDALQPTTPLSNLGCSTCHTSLLTKSKRRGQTLCSGVGQIVSR
jgi:hypothetical protein